MPPSQSSRNTLWWLVAGLGWLALLVVVQYYAISDWDIWAKLTLGSMVVELRHFPLSDPFAFTPTWPRYLDHEWGAGAIFYLALKHFGPAGLVWLRAIIFAGVFAIGLLHARRRGAAWPLVLLLLPVAAGSFYFSFLPTVRSHVFTMLFLAAALATIEAQWRGAKWPRGAFPLLMLFWTNLHGGFIMGLLAYGIYLVIALARPALTPARRGAWLGVFLGGVLITLINPWGMAFWTTIYHALSHPRPQIVEWQPLPVFAWDNFAGFRIACIVAIALLIFRKPWREPSNWPALGVLLLTSAMGWRARRHGALFGIAFLVLMPGLLQPWLYDLRERAARTWFASLGVAYVLLAGCVFAFMLPQVQWRPITPPGNFPIMPLELLDRTGATGNMITPFHWGSFVSWRLYPKIKVSMDGRYEAAYPEATHLMNQDFYEKFGPQWDRILRTQQVDYILIDDNANNVPQADLTARGFRLVLAQDDTQLYARAELAEALARTWSDMVRDRVLSHDPFIIRPVWKSGK